MQGRVLLETGWSQAQGLEWNVTLQVKRRCIGNIDEVNNQQIIDSQAFRIIEPDFQE